MKWLLYILPFYILGQTYPMAEPNNATYGSYVAPNGFPNYLEWFDTDLSDSRIMRVSDRQAFGVTNQRLRHNYSKDQTWNSNETLIKLAGYPAAILDAQTYEFMFWSNIGGYGRWSNTQPNLVYGTNGNALNVHDVTTNQRSIVRTFNEYDSIDFGFGEGNLSNDDRYIGLIGRNGSALTLITYNIPNNQIIATLQLPNNNVDWFSVSQSGNYAVLCYDTSGNGANQGIKSYNIFLQNETHIADATPHGDLGYDAWDNEVFVGYGNEQQWNDQHSLFMTRLDGGGITNLFPYVNGLGIWGGHISCRNINRPGWAYVSEQCCYTNPVAPAELFAIKLDGSGTIERYAKHNSKPSTYLHETQLVPNRNGTKIIFASNWFYGPEVGQESAHAFVLEVNQETLSIDEISEIELPISTEYYNILGQKVSKNYQGFLIEKRTYQNRVEYKKTVNAKISRD